MGQVNRLRLLSESELLLGASLPVTVDVQQQVGGADGESDSVPEAISQAVGEGLGARLAFEAVVIADLLSHSAALQFKVTAAKKKKKKQVRASEEAGRSEETSDEINSRNESWNSLLCLWLQREAALDLHVPEHNRQTIISVHY